MVFIFMLAVVFVLCHCYAVCPQGLPVLPTLAALHSNQILTVKVCWLCQTAQADSMDYTHWEISTEHLSPVPMQWKTWPKHNCVW